MTRQLPTTAFSLLALFLAAFMPRTRMAQEPWPVPDSYKNKVNPLRGNAPSLNTGKALYNDHCRSCHGTKGKGDGPRASQLEKEPGDLSKASFKSQTDGTIFYKVYQGRGVMPSFKTTIPEANDIWALVNFIRTLP